MLLDSIQSLAVFVKVAETGSLTAAADRLHVSPSAVSKSLRLLETRLKVTLITRTTRSVRLTDEGRALLEQCRHILTSVEEVEALLARRKVNPSGCIRLLAPVGFGHKIVMPQIVRILQEFPELSIDMELSDRVADPVEEGIDVAIRLGYMDDDRMVARKLCDTDYVAVASPRYLKEHGEPNEPADLAQHRCLNAYMPHRGRHREWEFVRDQERIQFKPPPGCLNINSAEALMYAAVAGMGITIFASYIATEKIRAGELKAILPKYRCNGPTVWIYYGEQRMQLPKVKAVVQYLVDHTQAEIAGHHTARGVRPR